MPPPPRYPPGVQAPLTSNSAGIQRPGLTRTTKGLPLKPGTSAGGRAVADGVDIEEFRPPEWRTVLNRRADLGYPDFYPSRPGHFQPEDVLTEENVKSGFSGKTPVAIAAECFSMHGPIYNHLMSGGLDRLIKLGREVQEKRNEAVPGFKERSFRIPARVTYNDTKRFLFLSELGNPAIPLHRLMKASVPHGFKGVELLDTMFSPPSGALGQHNRTSSGDAKPPSQPIPVDRALWFIRILGANEITAHRGRALPTPALVQAPSPAAATPSSTTTVVAPIFQLSSNDWYTLDFTNTFLSWMRIQLGQLALPTKKTGSQPAKPLGVLGDEKSRARWLAKWDYSTSLLRELHARRLLSSRVVVGWLSDTLSTSNLAQLGFLAQLVGELLGDMGRHVSIGRHCVRSCCDKIKEIRSSPAATSLKRVEDMLISVINTLYLTNEDVLVSPSTWKDHAELLQSITSNSLEKVKSRNEALFFKAASTESNSSPRRLQMEEIHKLDSICADTNMSELCKSFFHGPSAPNSATLDMIKLEEKIYILLNWAMGLFHLGSHRPYAVYTLFKMWIKQYDKQPSASRQPPSIDLFPLLYNWLDKSDSARKVENAPAIGITFGELTRSGLFHYGRYLQMLIARGQTARCQSADTPSHHLTLLRAMPIFVQAKDLSQQRRLALCGDDIQLRRESEAEEERILSSTKEEIREYVPEVFGMKRYGQSSLFRDAIDHTLQCVTMDRYSFVTVRFWLAPAVMASFVKQEGIPAIGASTFARLIYMFEQLRAFASMADVILYALIRSKDDEILSLVIDVIRREADVWTAMDRWEALTNALGDRFHKLLKHGRYHSDLADLLLELAHRRRFKKEDAEEVQHAKRKYEQTRSFRADEAANQKDTLSAIRQAIIGNATSEATALGSKVFARHGPFALWFVAWWAMILKAVESLPNSRGSFEAALAHLSLVNEISGKSLDGAIGTWIDGLTTAGRAEVFGQQTAVASLLLHLVAARLLSSVTILEKLGYPEWKHSASICLSVRNRLLPKQLRATETIISICHQLLLTSSSAHLPPTSLRQALIFQTSRARVFHRSHIQNLIQHLPFLVVLQQAKSVHEPIREKIGTLLRALAMTPKFKTAAFRHLDLLKDAFLSNQWNQKAGGTLEAAMVDTLKLIMSDGTSRGPKVMSSLPSLDSASRFSAWRWTRIVLEMRVEFKRLAMRIQNGEDVAEAKQTLNLLVHSSLNRDASADDTDLLCEAFRGIEPEVGQEILAAGLDRLATLLAQVMAAEQQHQTESAGQSIDQMLRILDSTRKAADKLETGAIAARDRLLNLLAVGLQSVERQITSDTELQIPDMIPPHPGDLFRIVVRILRFTLGLTGFDSSLAAARPDFSNLAVYFLRVAVAVMGDSLGDESTRSMGDILIYIIDSAPIQSRSAVFTALLNETYTPTIQQALEEIPSLLQALPYKSPVRRPVSLKTPHVPIDAESLIQLDDRPWEMFDQMVPVPGNPPSQDEFLSSKPLADTSSVSMSLFTPIFKRDAVPDNAIEPLDDPTQHSWTSYSSERNLGNGLTGEPVSVRQAATRLYNRIDRVQSLEHDKPEPNGSSIYNETVLSSIRPRRASTRLQNPPVGVVIAGTTHDPITIDSDDDENDDDLEVIDVPAAKRPRTASKSTASKTTGGKTIQNGRPATGGKGISRKAAGKSTGTRGGKTTRGRRKSGAE